MAFYLFEDVDGTVGVGVFSLIPHFTLVRNLIGIIKE
jgi:hypothetical protein